MPIKVDILGGNPGLKRFLSILDLENPEENGKKYDDWASSVKDFPQIIDQKVWKHPLTPKLGLGDENALEGLKG